MCMMLDEDVITCSCYEGKELMDDGKTCLGMFQFRTHVGRFAGCERLVWILSPKIVTPI